MNNKGQFFLYDVILAIFILFLIVTCMIYVIEEEDDSPKNYYTEVQDTLILLESTEIHNTNLLEALGQNNSYAKEVASDILSDKKYTLKDLTLNKTLLRVNSGDYNEVITCRKTVEGHEYELSFYI